MDEKKYMLLIGADFVPEEGTTSCQDVPVARKLLSFYVQCDIGQLTFLVERVQSIQQSLLLRIQSSIILSHLLRTTVTQINLMTVTCKTMLLDKPSISFFQS